MKVLKRLNKLHDKILKKMARGLPVDHILVMDVMARTAPYVVDSDPEMIFYMTEPSKEVQLKSLRSDGKLLLRKSDWTIDTEAEFPGSTSFKEFVLPRIELCNVDNENLPLCRDMFKNRKPSKADFMWKPISELSKLPAADITEMDRAILRGLPYPEAVLHIQHLLDKHASPQLEPVTVVAPGLQASFNHCMATVPEKDCANDNVMVIQA
jgi:hypothetical protein